MKIHPKAGKKCNKASETRFSVVYNGIVNTPKTLMKRRFTYGNYTTDFVVWVEEIESLGDLERLRLVIEYMPDEELMDKLERERKNGRDDYPVRAMWNAMEYCSGGGVSRQTHYSPSLRREGAGGWVKHRLTKT